VDIISSQVQSMGLANNEEPAEARPAPFKSAEDESRLFIDNMFLSAGAPALCVPAPPRHKKASRLASAEPLKSVVPVSKRATTRLIRHLDLADPRSPIGEAKFKQLADLFRGILAQKTIEPIRAATRLADDQVSKVTAAMAAEELAAQVEAPAA
jgi:hypothetical protein